MKKAFKTIIAAMLAAIMALSGISAFAAEKGDKLDWVIWEDYTETYTYEGEITVGENTLEENSETGFVYYTLNIEESGFYAFDFKYYGLIGWYSFPEEIKNGTAYEQSDYVWVDDEDGKEFRIYYLEKGENILGIEGQYGYEFEGNTLTVEYYGDSIEKITIADDLIIGVNYFCYEVETDSGTEYSFDIESDIVYTFSNGKTVTDSYSYGEALSDATAGEQEININFCDKYFKVKVNLIDINSIIKDVEISNINDYLTVYEYYDYNDYRYPYDETVTVTLVGGEKITAKIDDYGDHYIKLENGKKIYIYFDYDKIDGKYSFIVYAGSNALKSYECTVNKASVSDNFNNLSSNISYNLSRSFYYLKQAVIDLLECDSVYEFTEYGVENIATDLGWAVRKFMDIFYEIKYILEYYVV